MTLAEKYNLWIKRKMLQWRNPFSRENWEKKESEK